MMNFDMVVIGGGPGGYTAAIRASQLGLKVALVEREVLGGVCLNWGCIPTKALLKAAEMKRSLAHAAEFGLKVKDEGFDFTRVIARSREVAEKLSKGVSFLMKKNKVEVIKGTAVLKDKNTVVVEGKVVTFGHAILATGARAKQIAGVLEADNKLIWNAKEAMVPAVLPKTLLIVGAGAIGVEFASFYSALGTEVTLVEAQDRIVPMEDEEVSKLLKKELEGQGMNVWTSAKVEGLKANPAKDCVNVVLNGEAKVFERALLAIGVVGNVEGLGLEAVGVKVEKGAVVHNDMMQTSVPNLYAIGDVAGGPWLAHVASHEGVVASEHIAFALKKAKAKPHGMDYTNIPGCTYCTPQVASTGYTEAAAKAKGYAVKVGRFNYAANGKALAIDEPTGFVKTVLDAKTGALLGAHIIGAEATEMISTFVLGRHVEAVEEDFFHACLPHPTLSEMIMESVLDGEGRVLNS
ncbi:MAG: dihydrolipoyl dehydrogenase [Alphaproteobacteria bacterium]